MNIHYKKYIKYFMKNKNIMYMYGGLHDKFNDDYFNFIKEHPKLEFIDSSYGPNFKFGSKNTSAIIVPHAGSKYIKNILDYVFSDINNNFKFIVLLTTNHYDNNSYQMVKETEYIKILQSNNIIKNDSYWGLEHSYLSILPYFQQMNKPVYIFSIGKFNYDVAMDINNLIQNEHVLLVANTDLLHCGIGYNVACPNNIKQYNIETINNIIKFNDKTKLDNRMCGHAAIETFNFLIKNTNKYKYAEYVYTSSDIVLNDTTSSVGYVGIIYNKFGKPDILNSKYLLNLPKDILEKYVDFDGIINLDMIFNEYKKFNSIELYMKDINGIFITIYNGKRLRGCIGTFSIINDIIYTIIKQTIESAFYDSRFFSNKITKNELKYLSYKINFLKNKFIVDKNNLFKIIKVGLHGIEITFDDGKKATYLASVLPELGISQNNFIEKYDMLILSLKDKSGSHGNVEKIELYECIELE
jgi:AmmeMemoRadiSam system protein B